MMNFVHFSLVLLLAVIVFSAFGYIHEPLRQLWLHAGFTRNRAGSTVTFMSPAKRHITSSLRLYAARPMGSDGDLNERRNSMKGSSRRRPMNFEAFPDKPALLQGHVSTPPPLSRLLRHATSALGFISLSLLAVLGLARRISRSRASPARDSPLGAGELGDARRHVVIVGGGFGGLNTARLLSKDRNLRVTLVEPKDYFEYTPGLLRALVEPQVLRRLHVPLRSAVPKRCAWTRGRVTAVVPQAPGAHFVVDVQLTNPGAAPATIHLPCDEVVLSTGAHYSAPIRPSLESELSRVDRVAALESACQRVTAAAAGILICGGGIVGVELAGEVIHAHPRHRVYLVSRSPALLSDLPPKASRAALQWLQARGVEVILGDTVVGGLPPSTSVTESVVTLTSGRTFLVALAFDCTGSPPAAEYLQHGPAAPLLGPSGSVRVDSHLRAQPGLWALGDVIQRTDVAVPDGRTAIHADLGARIVARALCHPSRAPSAALPSPIPRVMVVSLGKRAAIMVMGSLVLHGCFWGRLAALVKLFIEVTKVWEVRQVRLIVWLWAVVDAVLMRCGGRGSTPSTRPTPAPAALAPA